MTTSEQKLDYFNRNQKVFLRRFVTMDKTWIHHYTSESREGSKQSATISGESLTTLRMEGRLLEHIMLHYLIDWFDKIRKKRPHLKKKIIFHDHNAPSHTSNIAQAKKHELGFESTVFIRPGPQRLLSVPKLQEMAVW